MLGFVIAYFAGGLAAAVLYVRLAHRLECPPDQDPEAAWWEAYAQASQRLGHKPRRAEVLGESRRAA